MKLSEVSNLQRFTYLIHGVRTVFLISTHGYVIIMLCRGFVVFEVIGVYMFIHRNFVAFSLEKLVNTTYEFLKNLPRYFGYVYLITLSVKNILCSL